jgi:protease YdgD
MLAATAFAAGLPGIGPVDPRVPVDAHTLPWSQVARLQIPGVDRCTAFLIAPRLAITAAHCLYAVRLHRYARPDSVHLLTGYASGEYRLHSIATSYRVASGYDAAHPYAALGSDIAVLTLAAPLGDGTVPLPLASAAPVPGLALALGGFSQDRAEVLLADQGCEVVAVMNDEHGTPLLRHSCTATHGTSGAPLLSRQPDGAWAVVGVQVAALITGSGGAAVPAASVRALLAAVAAAK